MAKINRKNTYGSYLLLIHISGSWEEFIQLAIKHYLRSVTPWAGEFRVVRREYEPNPVSGRD